MRRLTIAALTLLLAMLLFACGGDDDGDTTAADDGAVAEETSDEPIVIGMAIAQSGPIAPFDIEPGQSVELRAQQINDEGGVLGRQIRVVNRNTQSDPNVTTNVAQELVDEGAAVIVASCDFDYGSPAAIVAQSNSIPGISLCASDPKFGDATTIGDFAFSFAPGSDVEAALGAEWAYNERDWTRAILLQDESIEYTKALGRYFTARWEELGGELVGQESFPGGDNVNIDSQAQAIRQMSSDADFVYVASWNPGGAAAIRQLRQAGVDLPILGPAALDGALLTDTAGNVSDVFFTPFACFVYCTGGEENAQVTDFADAFEAEFGNPPSTSYTIQGYNLMSVVAQAIEEAGTTDGPALRDALVSLGEIESPTGTFEFFNETCHKPTPQPLILVEVQNGEHQFIEPYAVERIPDLGDGNACATQD